jgi:hypothetical protein
VLAADHDRRLLRVVLGEDEGEFRHELAACGSSPGGASESNARSPSLGSRPRCMRRVASACPMSYSSRRNSSVTALRCCYSRWASWMSAAAARPNSVRQLQSDRSRVRVRPGRMGRYAPPSRPRQPGTRPITSLPGRDGPGRGRGCLPRRAEAVA